MMDPRRSYVLTVMARDRPGIVAAVSEAILELDGNVASASQTVLGGYFTLIMIAGFPTGVSRQQLTKTVEAKGGQDRFEVCVQDYEPQPSSVARPPGTETFIITLIGTDRPGVIYRFAGYLADRGINIVDFYGYLQEQQFVMVCQVDIPPQYEIAQLQADLQHLGEELNFTAWLQHEDVFIATNELRLSREHYACPPAT